MSLNKSWAIFRHTENGILKLVHQADKMQDARYWLMYIANIGDALFKTPLHPRYTGNGKPYYESHLEQRQKAEHNEGKWKAQVGINDSMEVTFLTDTE